MARKRLSPHDREEILRLKAEGKTNDWLAAKFKVTEGGIRYVLRSYKPGSTAARHKGSATKLTPRCDPSVFIALIRGF